MDSTIVFQIRLLYFKAGEPNSWKATAQISVHGSSFERNILLQSRYYHIDNQIITFYCKEGMMRQFFDNQGGKRREADLSLTWTRYLPSRTISPKSKVCILMI